MDTALSGKKTSTRLLHGAGVVKGGGIGDCTTEETSHGVDEN